MKKNFRRIVSLLLALVMAMSLAVSAAAAELRMNSLAAYGEKDIVITSESITEEAQSLEVTSLGPVKTYTCTGSVTVVNTYEPTAEEPYSFFGVQPLHYNSTSGEYFISDDDGYLDDGFTCTLTENLFSKECEECCDSICTAEEEEETAKHKDKALSFCL